jgi:hypothetical protein
VEYLREQGRMGAHLQQIMQSTPMLVVATTGIRISGYPNSNIRGNTSTSAKQQSWKAYLKSRWQQSLQFFLLLKWWLLHHTKQKAEVIMKMNINLTHLYNRNQNMGYKQTNHSPNSKVTMFYAANSILDRNWFCLRVQWNQYRKPCYGRLYPNWYVMPTI